MKEINFSNFRRVFSIDQKIFCLTIYIHAQNARNFAKVFLGKQFT